MERGESVDGQNGTGVGGVDELLDLLGVQRVHQGHDGGIVLVTGLDGDDVGVGLGGVGGGILGSQSILGGVQTGLVFALMSNMLSPSFLKK